MKIVDIDHSLSSSTIQSYLKESLQSIPIHVFNQVESTNDLAYDLISKSTRDRLIVLAEMQTSGRGRRGRAWTSPTGTGLLMSLAWSFESPAAIHYEEWPLFAAWAAHQTISQLTNANVEIKWPNDILIAGKKSCGILTELSTSGNKRHLIVGFGINVNLRSEDLPTELIHKATSLLVATGHTLDRNQLAAMLITQMDKLHMNVLQGFRFADLRNTWISHCHTIGKQVQILQGKELIEGLATSIDQFGILDVVDHLGMHHRIASGEIIEGAMSL